MKFIGVDLDWINPRELIKTYILASYYIKGKGRVRVYRSSSGQGYHFKIELNVDISPLENLYWRVMLGDDVNRIKFSIKRLLSDPNGADVIFDGKGKGEEVDITDKIEKFTSDSKSRAFLMLDNNADVDEITRISDYVYRDMVNNNEIESSETPVLVVSISDSDINNFVDLGKRLSSKYDTKFKIIKSLESDRDFYFTLSGQDDKAMERWSKWFDKKFNKPVWIKYIKHEMIRA